MIKEGDLVYVAKPMPCCGWGVAMGLPLVVESFTYYTGDCLNCGKVYTDAKTAIYDGNKGVLAMRLRKFDPLSEPSADERTVEREKADECPFV